jgi:hypothetical protein
MAHDHIVFAARFPLALFNSCTPAKRALFSPAAA